MSHSLINKITEKQKRPEFDNLKAGMIVRLVLKVKEGKKIRHQTIEGIIISRKHGKEINSRITLRRIVSGVGIEWTLPLYSPQIEKIEILKAPRVRRAKLYYLRKKSQKQAKLKLKKEKQKKIVASEIETKGDTPAQVAESADAHL